MRLSIPSMFLCSLFLSGCQVVKDYQYIQATNLEAEGQEQVAFRKYLRVAQDDNYPDAQMSVADAYLQGKGVDKDVGKAIIWYERASRSQDVTWAKLAIFNLGDLFFNGEKYGIQTDRIRSVKYMQRCDSLGEPGCTEYLAWLEEYPDVYVYLNPDIFTDASDQLAPAGMEYADKLYLQGKTAEAITVYQWHAKRGNGLAQLQMARLDSDAKEQAKDLRRSQGWTYLAAKNGVPEAQHLMGRIFYMDAPTITSDTEAKLWLQLASDQGYFDSTNLLGVIELHPGNAKSTPNYVKAKSLFERAAQQGSIDSVVNLGDMYLHGLGGEKDRARAREFYSYSAQEGSIAGRLRLFQHFDVTTDTIQHTDATQPDSRPTSTIKEAQTATKKSLVELFATLTPSVHKIVVGEVISGKWNGKGHGSAVSISPALAITNYHVVHGSTVIWSMPTEDLKDLIIWKVIGFDPGKDLAVLMSPDRRLSSVTEFRSSQDLSVGEKVFAIGSPGGLTNTLSEGIVSGVRLINGISMVQTTAPFTHGSSGGALFDQDGKLIGITKGGLEVGNLNFAVSADEITKLLVSLG
jgi:TPR repeat protein